MSEQRLYRSVCESHPEIPVFAQYWWLDAVCKRWTAVVSKKGDHISGAWAYPLEQKAGTSLIRNPYFTPYLGPTVFFPDDIKESNKDGHEYEVMSQLIKQLDKAKVWNLAFPPGMHQAGILKRYGLTLAVQQTFILDLAQDERTLLANMKESLRKNIRQAEKELTVSNEPEMLPVMFAYYKHMLERKGKTPYMSESDLQRLMDACIQHNAGALWVARSNDTIHGMVWQVWDNKCSYALCLAQNPASQNYKAMSLLLWQAIKEAKHMGQTSFDLEGSMDDGVERFYRSFGGHRSLYIIATKNESSIWKIKEMLRG